MAFTLFLCQCTHMIQLSLLIYNQYIVQLLKNTDGSCWQDHFICGGSKEGLVTLPWTSCAAESTGFEDC